MAKVVVIGIPGEPGLWLADLGNGTVRPLDSVTGDLATANSLRAKGGAVIKSVDFAVAVSSADEVFSGHFDG
ncbi:hypothetical protein PYH37_004764 [Sinorhizobium numidicum]|uniref:Uncharacterized protein n=1 Tax=Sinorhizobium numidicum TaxID=680248 RepID=A0ABY8CWU8_9HYPH|nr:hypothetical protein [Sinorhizobium numidicum]WEX76457.1 hypothetical protein PYH37_004764 [Sinorhizobium numidicum]WEX83118.1 hypothetical protein PYH38_005476 [Sinorhizobium numidicum]